MKGESPKKGRLGRKLLLSLVTVVIVLLIGEGLARWLYPDNPESRWSQHFFKVDSLGFSELNDIMTPDPDLFWRVKPGLVDRFVSGFVGTETFLNFKVSTDSKGLRVMGGPATEDNLLFLGDSCTFGIGVKAEEVYASLAASAFGCGARNLSCPGYTLYQGKKLLALLGWNPEPKALVAAFGFNDRLIWDGLTDPEQDRILSRRNSFLARHSRLFYCAGLAVGGGLDLLKKGREPTTRRVPPELFAVEAEELAGQAKKAGIPLVFLFFPRIEWMDEEGVCHPYVESIDRLEAEGEVAVLDLAETFRQNGGRSLYLDGIHPTPEGHRIAAEKLTRLLREMGVQ